MGLPQKLTRDGPWSRHGWASTDHPPPRVQLAVRFASMSASCLCFKCCSPLLVLSSFFPLCHFFFLSPTFCLHADKFLCFTSPKTPSSSWMSHLSALHLSVLQLTWFFPLAPALGPGTYCAFYCIEALRSSVK